MKLDAREAEDALWKKIEEHFEARLLEMRMKNDNSLDVEKTAAIRGRIQEIKYLLALVEPAPAIAVDESD